MSMKLYLATSPRNLYRSVVSDGLSAAGHIVVQTEEPPWNSALEGCTLDEAQRALAKVEAEFDLAFDRMADSDAFVLLLPAAPMAYMEAGWLLGRRKRGVVLVPDGHMTPQLSYKLFEREPILQAFGALRPTAPIVSTVEQAIRELENHRDRVELLKSASTRCRLEGE